MRFLIAFLAMFVALPASAQIIPVPGRTPAPQTTDKENLWLLDLSDGGRVTILLRPDVAPKMVERIKTLTRRHFYDGLAFHRVIEGFMAQGGDPKGDGTGGSDLPDLPKEFNYLPHVRGAVSAAREGAPEGATQEQKDKAENSANSQFFIMFVPRLSLDQKYTVFGRVIEGMQWVDKIERGEPPANPTRILHAYIAADNPPPYAPAPAAAPPTLEPVTLPGVKPAPTKP
ncbi:peptidylprolyl isomerase [Sphingomonas sp. DT-204]|uniref:peptidylprolyl isomerase n=1 Tax=Sphingomonas sp. DT-204 TaxID=3396166 RepID=UPI003F1B26AD